MTTSINRKPINRKRTAVYTSAEVRELDRIAIEDFGVPGYELMTRAAQATFALIEQHWPAAGNIAVVCGAGNNAGDGYVLARLALAAGWQVDVMALVAAGQLKGDASQACQDFIQAGGVIMPWQTTALQYESADGADSHAALTMMEDNGHRKQYALIVDALLGTGLQREVAGRFAAAVSWINEQPVPVIAIDIPSGLDADTGQIRGCAVKATYTLTYIAHKQGLLTGQARDYTGELCCDDLGVDDEVYARLPTQQWVITEADIAQALPPRSRAGHKGAFGHSLLLGGAPGMSGAIRLAGEAALRAGSGLVTLATHPDHAAYLNLNRPELMVAPLAAVNELRPLVAGKKALGIGPGLGQNLWAQQLLLLAMRAEAALVLDADALNLLAKLPRRQDNWVLTPHPAEAARLLGCETTVVEQDRVAAVKAIQQQFGGVCVLKGAGTLIADNSEIAFCTAGNPGMASGGMGDVLSGIITALLAQGLGLFQAAYTGVQVHAMAADSVAEQGERGLIASDVIAQLRGVVNP